MNNCYFTFCDNEIWSDGFMYNTFAKDQCLYASKEGGYYLSKALDSGENDTEWDSVMLAKRLTQGGYIRFAVYASNDRCIMHNNIRYPVDELACGELLSPEEKRFFFNSIMVLSYINPEKAPLYGVKGRFLWFGLEFAAQRDNVSCISLLRIYSHADSFMRLLPDVYSRFDKDNFMKSFVSIFQNIFEEYDDEIVNVYKLFDIDYADREGLKGLAAMKGLEVSDEWDKERLHELLMVLNDLYAMKGTKWALSEIIRIFIGRKPHIVEVAEKTGNTADAYSFKIYLPYDCITSRSQYDEFVYLIDKFKPAFSKASLILLRPETVLDSDTFIGENAVLNENSGLVLDGSITLTEDSFDTGIVL